MNWPFSPQHPWTTFHSLYFDYHFFSAPTCRCCLCVWNMLHNLVCFGHPSTCIWFSTCFTSFSTIMETFVLEVSSLIQLFTHCDLSLYVPQILDLFFFFLIFVVTNGSGFPYVRCWAFLSTWPTSLFLPLSFPPHPKTSFLDNSGCLLTSWSCWFLSLWGNESLSYSASVSRQDIALSATLKSSITGAIFSPSSTPQALTQARREMNLMAFKINLIFFYHILTRTEFQILFLSNTLKFSSGTRSEVSQKPKCGTS